MTRRRNTPLSAAMANGSLISPGTPLWRLYTSNMLYTLYIYTHTHTQYIIIQANWHLVLVGTLPPQPAPLKTFHLQLVYHTCTTTYMPMPVPYQCQYFVLYEYCYYHMQSAHWCWCTGARIMSNAAPTANTNGGRCSASL